MSDYKLKYLIIFCIFISIHGFQSLSISSMTSSTPSSLPSVSSKSFQCKLKLNQRYQMMIKIHHDKNDVKKSRMMSRKAIVSSLSSLERRNPLVAFVSKDLEAIKCFFISIFNLITGLIYDLY